MKREFLIENLLAQRERLQAQGVHHLAIFGSRARGDEKPGSDVDVLLDIPRGSSFSLVDLVGIEQIISDALGIPANAFMRRNLDHEFSSSIESDVVDIF